LQPPPHRCLHPQCAWFPMPLWPPSCSRPTCRGCWRCLKARTWTCKTSRGALHPTLTRVWSRAGRSGQRLVQAPGKNCKRYGVGLVDWRDGHLDFALAERRRAAPLVAQLRRAVQRSKARGRVAMVILDNLGIHTPKGSRLLRALLVELGEDLVLVYTPTYDPDANRIEWLWRSLRRTVTHTHQRQTLAELVADADRWARTIPPAQVLSQIGSPFALDQQPPVDEELNHAA
jgi:transposase